ncbi:MAG: DUF4145 domain-containing protein [Thaumarchaeota archaeon]|nr:DUF4145 domain-containing protein [Nitrososphaerota archaeon]
MSSDVISVRVRRNLKEEAFRLGIDVRNVVEEGLEKAIRKQKEKKIKATIEKIKQEMRGVTEKQWLRSVKESRKKRILIST